MSDLQRLRAAGNEYRRAVEALGIAWPSPAEGDVDPPPRLAEYYGIAEVPGELLWLHSFLAPGPASAMALPDGGWLLPWPASALEALQPLEYFGAMPFAWRSQIPVFQFEYVVFTLALDDVHAGEVWRYEIDPEGHQVVRAAPDLATVFEIWGQIAARDGFFQNPYSNILRLRSDGDGDEEYLSSTIGVDRFAYPVALLSGPETEARQRASGVDPELADDFGVWEATHYEIAALAEQLDG